ncbi:MAG: aminoacyl-tRNA hydrolase [Pseudomonadota bacterium]
MSGNTPIQLIVGLGNPGKEYRESRHNLGMSFVQQLLNSVSAHLSHERKFHGDFGKAFFFSHEVHVLLPTTFMNLSGQAVRAVAEFYKIPPEAMLVVHDDMDLPVGAVRLKKEGGHGGHNGLRDIIRCLGSSHFSRLRIGIGHPVSKSDVGDYVLERLSKKEQILVEDAMQKAMIVLPDVIAGELDKAMQRLHSESGENYGL